MSSLPSTSPSPPAPGAASQPPAPVASLARQLTRRAIDLFVVSFLILVGVSVGRQLIEWWRVDPNPTAPDLSDLTGVDLDWNHTPVTLRFGDASTALERIPFHGGRKLLEEELTSIGKSTVESTGLPQQPMDEAETGWLKALEGTAPVLWDSTKGNVYRRHEPLPTFVATRFVDINDPTAPANGQRIVGWGLAFPTSPLEWTIYVFHPDGTRTIQPPAAAPTLEMPVGSRNITTLRGNDGCQWRVIQGRGEIDGWVQHFHSQFEADSVVARIVEEQTASLKYRRDQIMTDVQIRREPDGQLTGVIWSANERKSAP
ncbi:MAG: hypothetical protein JSS49_20605 [Planctomycetes bacterium]|nr:hypothetical protein [Planctomycetota bacterium]